MPMYYLAFETSSTRGSLALCSPDGCLREVHFPEGLLHGREIALRAADALAESGRAPSDLSAVAVSLGPGSFTGLRVGVTAAKTLAFALRIAVVAESSLRVVAAGFQDSRDAGGCEDILVPVLDGRRRTYFAAAFAPAPAGSGDPPARLFSDGLFRVEALVEAIGRAAGGRGSRGCRAIVLGEGADAFLQDLGGSEGGEVEVEGDGEVEREGEGEGRTPSAGLTLRTGLTIRAGLTLVRGASARDAPRASVLGRLVAGRVPTARFDAEEVHRLEPAYLRLADAEVRRGLS